MSEITITITADEDDLRGLVADHAALQSGRARRLTDAIAAALPKSRVVVKPGMVLRRKSDGRLGHAVGAHEVVWWPQHFAFTDGLDPDEWEVILDVE